MNASNFSIWGRAELQPHRKDPLTRPSQDLKKKPQSYRTTLRYLARRTHFCGMGTPWRAPTVHFRVAQERGAAVVGRGAWPCAPTSGAGSSNIRGALDQRFSHLLCIFPTNSARSQKTLRQECFAFLSPNMQVEVAVWDLPRLGRNDPSWKRTEQTFEKRVTQSGR